MIGTALKVTYETSAHIVNRVLYVRCENVWFRTNLITKTVSGFGHNETLACLRDISMQLQEWLREDDQVMAELMGQRRGAA